MICGINKRRELDELFQRKRGPFYLSVKVPTENLMIKRQLNSRQENQHRKIYYLVKMDQNIARTLV